MKKLLIIFIVTCIFITGCSKDKDVRKNVLDKYDNVKGYKIDGVLSITNNDEVYNYDVDASYKKDDYYKVILTNKNNDHEQVILKNNDGVYIVTPTLNKSFKFNSEWPYNNSQVYLLNAIMNDIKNDSNSKTTSSNGKYIITTKVNYPNNTKLSNQKLEFDKNYNLKMCQVFDKDGVNIISMKFNSIKITNRFPKNYFKLDSIIKNKDPNNTKATSKMDDAMYPLFLPSGTKLVDEKKISKDNGERVIMTYNGDKSFLLVEETLDVFDEFTVIPTSGEPFRLMDALGVATSNSLSWVSGDVEYYLVSDVMSRNEMVEVASSIGNVSSLK